MTYYEFLLEAGASLKAHSIGLVTSFVVLSLMWFHQFAHAVEPPVLYSASYCLSFSMLVAKGTRRTAALHFAAVIRRGIFSGLLTRYGHLVTLCAWAGGRGRVFSLVWRVYPLECSLVRSACSVLFLQNLLLGYYFSESRCTLPAVIHFFSYILCFVVISTIHWKLPCLRTNNSS